MQKLSCLQTLLQGDRKLKERFKEILLRYEEEIKSLDFNYEVLCGISAALPLRYFNLILLYDYNINVLDYTDTALSFMFDIGVHSDTRVASLYEDFAQGIVVPNNIVFISSYAFINSLVTIANLSNVEVLGNGAFMNAIHLIQVNLDNNKFVKKIPADTFNHCSILIDFYARNSNIEEISTNAFEDCNMLKELHFEGSKLKTINEFAFKGCERLETIYASNIDNIEVVSQVKASQVHIDSTRRKVMLVDTDKGQEKEIWLMP